MNNFLQLFSTKPATDTRLKPGYVFVLLWVLLFCLYYPAARAGFVTDFTGWLDQVKNHSFSEFINRTHFQARSFYQLTQFNTWVCYKLFGIHHWPWHLLFITLHAINASLLYVFFRQLMKDAGTAACDLIALTGALLFCITPYISEVVVWEPSFHFLQGLLLIMLVLLCVQRYLHTGLVKYAWVAASIYGLSLFSLEIFYITPWLVASLALFYKGYLSVEKGVHKKVLQYFFIPMLLLLVVRFAGYRMVSGEWVSRIGTGSVTAVHFSWFGKPAKYLYHLLTLGRFHSFELRHKVYDILDSVAGILTFYALVLGSLGSLVSKFSKMGSKARVATLLFAWMLIALTLLVPLWFADDLLVIYDRYTYFAGAFFYMLCVVLISMLRPSWLRVGIYGLFAIINLRYAIQVSRYWAKSERIVTNLLKTIPDERSKTILLLNIPQCMHGIPMIGAEKNSEYKLMHDGLLPDKLLTNTVYDVLAYNMLTPTDGAHVNVINDSLIKVTLNQWGTWWWFETRGAYSYWTSDYRLDLKDPGHWYELTLRKPAEQFLILFNTGDQWKTVDMSKLNVDQN